MTGTIEALILAGAAYAVGPAVVMQIDGRPALVCWSTVDPETPLQCRAIGEALACRPVRDGADLELTCYAPGAPAKRATDNPEREM